jgi:peptide/nickel transport system permease protein
MTNNVLTIKPAQKHPAVRRFIQHRLALTGAIILIIIAGLAVFAGPLTSYAFDERDRDNRDSAPTSEHLLGTDRLGFDVWSSLVYSTRVSLTVGLATGLLVTGIGTLVGLIAGYMGGWIDQAAMRLADIMISFPDLVIILAAVALLGPGLENIVMVMGLILWPGTARLVRSQVLSLRHWDFVLAAQALGATPITIMRRHILPNVFASVIVAVTLAVASGILIEANLSFLGLGDPTQPSWGKMLNAAQSHTVLRSRWWLWIPPGLAIALCTLSINFVGDGLRDALDPYSKR